MEEFNIKNAYISEPETLVDGVRVRWLLEDGKADRMQFVIVLDEFTNYDSISIHRSKLKSLLKETDKAQGNNLDDQHISILYGLLKWHQERMGWGMMAMMLNYICIAYTYSSYEQMKNRGASPGLGEELLNTIEDPTYLSHFGGSLLIKFLALGMTLVDFNDWMKQGYELLSDNRLQLRITSEPFSRGRVREKVRYFDDRIKDGQITIRENDWNINTLEFSIYVMHQMRHLVKIDDLLDKEGNEDWKKHKGKIKGWVNKIIDRWGKSENQKIVKYLGLLKKWEKS